MRQYECPFHVGDTVIPKKPLDLNEGPGWADGMNFMVGKVYTIRDIRWCDKYYEVRIGDTDIDTWWIWKDSWLEPTDYSLF